LYFNATSLGATFLYDPQKSYDIIAEPEFAAVKAQNYPVTVPDVAPGNNYVWSLNGVPVNPPVNLPTYTISTLNLYSMGTYTCAVTNPNITGSFLYTFEVLATAYIEGKLSDENGKGAAGTVELYEITDVGAYRKTDEIETDSSFRFNVVLSDYVVKGIVNQAGFMHTWYGQTIFWEEADSVQLIDDNKEGIDINGLRFPGNGDPGEGIIRGTFIVEEEDGGKVKGKKRADNPVTVRTRLADAGRGKDETLIVVGYQLTDEEGRFVFEELKEVEHLLNIQYPGYPMDTTSFINIPVGFTLFDREIIVIAQILLNKIFVSKSIITGWEDRGHEMHAYPNPSTAYLFVTGPQAQSAHFALTDFNGKVENVSARWDPAYQRWEVDITTLPPGSYLLRVERNGKVESLRIVVQ